MAEFPHPNFSNDWHCPVCKTKADCPVELVPMPGTEHDGLVQCRQVHVSCVALVTQMNELERQGMDDGKEG
jgi:hypothetical protein